MPPELRSLGQSQAKGVAKAAARAVRSGAVGEGLEEEDEEDEVKQMRIANRERQMLMHAKKKKHERGGGGGGVQSFPNRGRSMANRGQS